jgi:hypothetical protein
VAQGCLFFPVFVQGETMKTMIKLLLGVILAAAGFSTVGLAQTSHPVSASPASTLAPLTKGEYRRFGPYSLSDAEDVAASIRKNFPKAYVIVRRDDSSGWFVHVYLSNQSSQGLERFTNEASVRIRRAGFELTTSEIASVPPG